MPRLRREVEEKIVELIDQGYKDSKISRKLGVHRTTVANRREAYFKRKQEEKPEKELEKNIQHEQPLDPQKYTQAQTDGLILSKSAMSRLNQLHELLDANSIDEMLEIVYADQVVAEQYRLEYTELMKENCPEAEAPKTFAGIIAEEQGYAADLKHDLDIYMKGYRDDRELKEELEAEAERQFDEGYQKGKNDYALLVPCTSCGQPITLKPGTETHRHIVEFCRELKIIHTDCAPRYRRIYV